VLPSFAPDCLEQDFTKITPGAYLSAIAPLHAAEHVLRAAMPDQLVRRSLRMPPGEPCLLVIRRTWAHGRPVSRARLWHPGGRFELTGRYAPPGLAPPESGGPPQRTMPPRAACARRPARSSRRRAG